MRRLLMLVPLVLLACSATGWADSERRVSNLADTIAPFVEEQTLGVVAIDVGRIDPKTIPEDLLLSVFGLRPEARQELGTTIGRFQKAGGKEFIAIFSLADMPIGPYLLVPIADASSGEALEKLFKPASHRARPHGLAASAEAEAAPDRSKPLPSSGPFAVEQRVGDVLFVGSEAAWKRLHEGKPAARPEIAKALAAVEGNAIRAILLPSADTKRAFEENAPNLPEELGGGPITAFTHGIRWAAVGIDLSPRLAVQLVIQSADGKAARTLADAVEGALKQMGKNEELRHHFPNYDALVSKLTPQVQGDRLTLAVGEGTAAEVIGPLAGKVRQQASWTQDINNLKQLGLAMHNYYDVHRTLPPPAIYSKDGKPLLSWRVAILPFVDELKLYKEFHLDEPWDSEHNKKLIGRMPEVYRSHTRKTPIGKTPYQVVVGESTLFRGPKGVTFREVTDGTANTIMIVLTDEAHAIDWTRPEDVRDDPKGGAIDAIGRGHKKFAVALADGSVRLLPTTIDPKTLKALFTRAGGETVDWSKMP